jgi:hypothetical protein
VTPPPPAPSPPAPAPTGFAFGSYGRVLAGSDLRGRTPEKIAVVAHAPRIVEPSYVETDLYYHWHTARGVGVRTVTTLAFGDTLFHYTGEFDAQPALRNLFLEATTAAGLSLWAGSRMYRGDDIYVLDWWPLDDLNTVGGGVGWQAPGGLRVDLHAGTNRLLDPFQHQTRDVSDPGGIGEVTVTQLDRQRLVSSLAVTHLQRDLPGGLGGKLKLYLEYQALPAGERRRADDTIERLPRDHGLSLGAQLGAWTDAGAHANLFARWSKGLTAFDELAAPSGLAADHSAWPATELVFGTGAAYDAGFGHVLGGAYARRFVDADASVHDLDDGWEYAVDLRPVIKVAGDVLAGVDLSYQVRFPRGLSPTTLLAADPAVAQIAPMLIYAPLGAGAYDRPQLRLVWRIARLNEAALDQYAPGDPRRAHATVHFLGVQAEWWFNSTTR